MLKRINNEKGFTLIELLIVIVIIGILAGIVIGLTGANARRKANDAQKKADMHELQNALEQYYVDNEAYPATSGWQATLTPDYLTGALTSPDALAYTYLGSDSTYTLQVGLADTNASGPNVNETPDPRRYELVNKQ